MSNNYILGAGIAGLLFAFYNEDYYPIDISLGGQMKQGLGPRYLYDTPAVRKFLNDLGMKEISLRKIRATCCLDNNDSIKYIDTPEEKLRKEYWEKTRGKDSEFKPTAMSSGILNYEVIDVDFSLIIKQITDVLLSRGQLKEELKTFIYEVDTLDRVIKLENGFDFEYDKIVTTIPATLLYGKILEGTLDFKSVSNKFTSWPKVFVKTDLIHFDLHDAYYNYIYYPQEKFLFHRSTLNPDCTVSVEYSGVTKEYIENTIQFEYSEITQINHAQICGGQVLDLNLINIMQLGRFAQWEHRIKTHDVLNTIFELGGINV